MKNSSRAPAISAAVLIVLLLAIAVVFGGCRKHVGPDGLSARFSEQKAADRILRRMDGRIADLGLNDSQQAFYEGIMSDVRKDLLQFTEERNAFKEKIRSEIAGQDPDMRAVAGSIREHMDGFHVLLLRHLDHMIELYEMLDDSQKEKVLEHLRKRKVG